MTNQHENLAASTAGAQGIDLKALETCPLCGAAVDMTVSPWRGTAASLAPHVVCPSCGLELWGSPVQGMNIAEQTEQATAALATAWNRRAALPTEAPEPVAMKRALCSLAEASRAVLKTLKPGQSLSPAGAALTNRLDSITAEIEASMSARARPATVSSAEPAKVKALEWEHFPNGFPAFWSARTPLGPLSYYSVEVASMEADPLGEPIEPVDIWMVSHGPGHTPIRTCYSLDEAKAAAQADYEQRIRSALEPLQNPQQLDRVAIMPNSVYLAARYSRAAELRGYRKQLIDAGFTVTSRWVDGSHELTKEGSTQTHHAERTRFAVEDEADCMSAATVISFTEEPRKTTTRGGRHVEFGMARASGKRLIVVGHRENVFHCLPGVEFHNDFASALRALIGDTK